MITIRFHRLPLLLLALVLIGCQSNPEVVEPGLVDDALDEVAKSSGIEPGKAPAPPVAAPPSPAVLDALLPPLHVDIEGQPLGEQRYDINVKGVEARDFFMGLVQDTPYSMTVAPGVEGKITLAMKNVTLHEVLEMVNSTYGYPYRRIGRGYQVMPIRMQTRVFQVNYLNVMRTGDSSTTVSAGRSSATGGASAAGGAAGGGQSSGKGTSITTRIPENAFWSELRHSIEVIIGMGGGAGEGEEPTGESTGGSVRSGYGGRSVAINPVTGLVVVRAMPLELEDVAGFLGQTQASMGRQVILEAKILEVELSDGFQAGIDWAGLASGSNGYLLGGQTAGTNPSLLRNPYTGAFIPFGAATGGYSTGNQVANSYESQNLSNNQFQSSTRNNSSAENSNSYQSNLPDPSSRSGMGAASYSASDNRTSNISSENLQSSSNSGESSGSSSSSGSNAYNSNYSANYSPGIISTAARSFSGISETLGGMGGMFSLALRVQDFAAFIDLLKTQGNVHVLSSPRVSTVNNQKAVIKVGSDEFFVTGVTSNTDEAGNVTPEIDLESFFSGVALDVTPQIDNGGEVTLHIHPTVIEVVDQTKTFTVFNQTQQLPLAYSSTRESDSIVRAQSGQVVVIGGLLKERRSQSTASTPILGDLPILGAAFRKERESTRKSELVILLRPIVVESNQQWLDSIEKSRNNLRRIRGEDLSLPHYYDSGR